MRTFEYSYDGLEAHISCYDADSNLLCTANFPTPEDAITFAEHDFNMLFEQAGLDPITEDELQSAKNSVTL